MMSSTHTHAAGDTPTPTPGGFKVGIEPGTRRLRVEGPARKSGSPAREYRIADDSHAAWLDFHAELARDFGTRLPLNRRPAAPPEAGPEPGYQVVLDRPIAPGILYGYGDPAVLRVNEPDHTAAAVYHAVVTSNDAPDAFPILRSKDLVQWECAGYVFPRGQQPGWSLSGPGVGDYWAPEMHRFGAEYRVYFAAREKVSGALAIGLARSHRPEGPFTPEAAPLLTGNVIDAHVLQLQDGTAYLFWKHDANDVWPQRLAGLLAQWPELIEMLFNAGADALTARFVAALEGWLESLPPMLRFQALQPFIESVTEKYAVFRQRLAVLRSNAAHLAAAPLIDAILAAMCTPIHAQRLSPDGASLLGEKTTVLTNDQDWEAHLVEGVWVSEQAGRYYLFYAGNDFSTEDYGIGVAVAEAPLGPYRKAPRPLLRSGRDWTGPGHPSLALDCQGQPLLFLHAFRPGQAGYKRFRALLALPVAFGPEGVRLR